MADTYINSDTADIPSVNFAQQGSDITAPAASRWQLFFKSTGLWAITNAASAFRLAKHVMTAAGDLTVGGASGVETVLAKGSALDVLRVNAGGTALEWAAPAAAGPSGELGHAEITGQLTKQGNTYGDAAGLSVSVTVGARPIVVHAYCPMLDGGASGERAWLNIYDVTGSAQVAEGTTVQTSASGGHVDVSVRLTPAAGARTYKVQYKGDNPATTYRLYASATAPAFIRVDEV